jgi:hypothetical protein
MKLRMKLSAILVPTLLAGCVPSPEPAGRAAPPPVVQLPGIVNVMGSNARTLERAFGRPNLDVREGPARKLQFSSPVCVLDTYLYPPRAGGEPIVTYVDARLPDGRDVDRTSCIAAISRRLQAR